MCQRYDSLTSPLTNELNSMNRSEHEELHSASVLPFQTPTQCFCQREEFISPLNKLCLIADSRFSQLFGFDLLIKLPYIRYLPCQLGKENYILEMSH